MKSYNESIPTLQTLQRLGHNSITMSIEQSAVLHHKRLSLHLSLAFGRGSVGRGSIILLLGVPVSFSGPPIGEFKR